MKTILVSALCLALATSTGFAKYKNSYSSGSAGGAGKYSSASVKSSVTNSTSMSGRATASGYSAKASVTGSISGSWGPGGTTSNVTFEGTSSGGPGGGVEYNGPPAPESCTGACTVTVP